MPRTAGCSSRRLDAEDTLTDLREHAEAPARDRGSGAAARSALVTPNPVNDGSSYRVLEIPTGGRTTARGRS